MVTPKGAYLVRYTMVQTSGGEKFAHAKRRGVARQRGTLQFLFKLMPKGSSVTQQGNPAVVPEARLLAAGMTRIAEVLK